MTGPEKAFFCGAEFKCVDPYKKGTVIDAVVRPEDIKITDVEKGQITGEVLSADFKGTFYNVVVRSGKTEIEANSLKYYEPGTIVGMKIAADNIHIIPYDNSINHYDGKIVNYFAGKGLLVEVADFEWYVEPERIFPGAVVEDGIVIGASGKAIAVEDVRIEAYIAPSDIKLSDDAEEGLITGNIVSFIYVDDHYTYTVRTKSEEDYVVHDVDLWNQEDFVSLIIPEDKVTFRVVRS